ncbi:MAG: EF-P beta-lysylation protein EpmB [Planctomycetaceae bacterium]|nr:EF-P beta-lysylation protein EpmB [Planctomycetaceae bacterium]
MDKTAPTAISQIWEEQALPSASVEPIWQRELRDATRSVPDLLEKLGLNPNQTSVGTDSLFPLLVPDSYLRRMEFGNPLDPLLHQILPRQAENQTVPGFQTDPVQDLPASPIPGLIHKYQNRVLLILTGNCAVHCRYCFRRHFPYEQSIRSEQSWEPALDYLAEHSEVNEVILSGGDPLIWNDRRLGNLMKRLAEIEHLKRIRIHSRLPIVLPSRITTGLLEMLRGTRLQPLFVVHANHARELVADCAEALQRIVQSGIPLLNQAVLLRNVNDTLAAQRALCERLVDLGAIPYYLHQLDRVAGAAHFEVDRERGARIVAELQQILPGYAVPRYVEDIPGRSAKTELRGDL